MNKDSVQYGDQIQQYRKSDSPRGIENIDSGEDFNRLKTMGATVTDDFYNLLESGEQEKLTGNEIIKMNELYGQRNQQ